MWSSGFFSAWAVGIALIFGVAACDVLSEMPKKLERSTLCEQGVRRVDATTVEYCGELDQVGADQLAHVLRDGDRELVLTSSGGDPLSALKVHNEVKSRNLRLRLRKICFSACAHFVFTPADDVVVEDNTVVGFHHTSALMEKLLGVRETPSDIAQSASAVRAMYSAEGLPIEFLYSPGLLAQPICVGWRGSGKDRHTIIKTRITLIVPTRAAIELVRGGPVSGFWPRSSEEIGRAHNSWKSDMQASFALGEPVLLSLAEIDRRAARVDACPPE